MLGQNRRMADGSNNINQQQRFESTRIQFNTQWQLQIILQLSPLSPDAVGDLCNKNRQNSRARISKGHYLLIPPV